MDDLDPDLPIEKRDRWQAFDKKFWRRCYARDTDFQIDEPEPPLEILDRYRAGRVPGSFLGY